MYPTSILFTLAAAVALVQAAVLPRADPTYDTCIQQFATIFKGQPSPTILMCASCAGKSIALAFITYGGNPGNVQQAKDTYKTGMAVCRGSTDETTYDTCLEQYGKFLEAKPTTGFVDCTGCAGKAVGAGFLAYGGKPENTELATATYTVEMAKCRAPAN